MIVDIISDLHGFYPKLNGGDLLIVAGDLTARDEKDEYIKFLDWLKDQDYKKIVLVAGNHDTKLENKVVTLSRMGNIQYLENAGCEFEYVEQINHPASNEHVSIDVLIYEKKKIKIWGMPWSLWFHGINPKCKAFTCNESKMESLVNEIPDNVDILISHGPAFGILDKVVTFHESFTLDYLRPFDELPTKHCGSLMLRRALDTRLNPRLLVTGHIHEAYGEMIFKRPGHGDENNTLCVNASIMNERYQPVNKPVRVVL